MSELKTQTPSFFLSCPIGVEKEAQEELLEKYFLLTGENFSGPIHIEEGGLRFEAPAENTLSVQKYLKLANRLLLTLEEFRCRDLPKLFKKISQFPWNNYLHNGQYQLKVSAKKSRLNNEKRIEQSFQEAMEKYFKANTPKKSSSDYVHCIYLRLFDDELKISLDLSGEHLHKRAYRTHHKAPLRENLAAFAYSIIKNKETKNTLLDPMMGSGSLLLEALEYYNKSRFRKFASDYVSLYKCNPSLEKDTLKKSSIEHIYGNDLETDCLHLAQENFKAIGSPAKSEFLNTNAFEKDILSKKAHLIFCNPPYGERITLPKNFWQDFVGYLKLASWEEAVLFVARDHAEALRKQQKHWQVLREIALSNGGIAISVMHLKKQNPSG